MVRSTGWFKASTGCGASPSPSPAKHPRGCALCFPRRFFCPDSSRNSSPVSLLPAAAATWRCVFFPSTSTSAGGPPAHSHRLAVSGYSIERGVCLHERLPSTATRRVQPLQLQEVVPSRYCRVSYSMLGLESDAKVQTRLICLFMIY